MLDSSQREPKGSPNWTDKFLKVPKVLKKSEANSGLEFKPEKGGPKCENRTPVNVLAPFPRFPGPPKNIPDGPQMEPKISKKLEKLQKLGCPKKQIKTDCQKVCKSVTTRQNGVSEKLGFGTLFWWNSRKSPKWSPWVSRARKGIPKASKRLSKGVQKAWKWRPKGVLNRIRYAIE